MLTQQTSLIGIAIGKRIGAFPRCLFTRNRRQRRRRGPYPADGDTRNTHSDAVAIDATRTATPSVVCSVTASKHVSGGCE